MAKLDSRIGKNEGRYPDLLFSSLFRCGHDATVPKFPSTVGLDIHVLFDCLSGTIIRITSCHVRLLEIYEVVPATRKGGLLVGSRPHAECT